jgi:hypothetical protein
VSTHSFLSEPWFDAVKEALAEGRPELPEKLTGVVINVRVEDADVDATYRGCWWEPGFSDDADVTLFTTRELAYEVIVKRNIPVGVRALSTGKAKIKGNRTKLLKLRSVQPSDSQAAFEKRVQEFTSL